MKRFLYRFVLPAIVLAVVYHFGYNFVKSAGIRSSTVLPPITSTPQVTAPASITLPASQPKVLETTETQPPTVKRVRKTHDGLVVEHRPVQALPVKTSDKAVFRSPNVSGVPLEQLEPTPQPELLPLKSSSIPATLPVLAKPQTAPRDDCDCGK
ncbi:MAG: hypothetical protein LBE12_08785 [Planctomycetaceae bacterium]|jgi:hypothetical protein|nr:hypothetical protein [Planctomycetaceae bacterium]